MGASFSSFGCFVFEIWVLRFRDLGASFSRSGCFVLPYRACLKHNLRLNIKRKDTIVLIVFTVVLETGQFHERVVLEFYVQ